MSPTVTKEDCEKVHEKLDESVSEAIKNATGKVESKLKLWILGGLVAVALALFSGYTCAVSEVGAYRERVDSTKDQLQEMKASNTRQFEELKTEIRQIRDLLLGRRQPWAATSADP